METSRHFNAIIEQIIHDVFEYWNHHDMSQLGKWLATEVIFTSPNIQRVTPSNQESELRGKQAVLAHLTALNTHHFFKVSLLHFHKHDRWIECRAEVHGQSKCMYAKVTLNEYGKMTQIEIEYR
jgi:hypothetical protein